MNITISQLHHILNEGTAEEVAQMQTQIAAIDAQIQRSQQPLIVRKTRLAAMLAQKQKALAAQNTQQAAKPQEPAVQQPTGQQPA